MFVYLVRACIRVSNLSLSEISDAVEALKLRRLVKMKFRCSREEAYASIETDNVDVDTC